ncbi:MAG TPA: GDSL-type esterase/lipase family protein, partial [Candidatus Obscuribacterales bacterium]
LVELPAEIVLDVPPAEVVTAVDEPVEMSSEALSGAGSAIKLRRCTAPPKEVVSLSGVLLPQSVRVKAGRGAQAAAFKQGTDYLLDGQWGALARAPSGAIKKGQTVYVDYKCSTARLDTLVINEAGKLSLLRGKPAMSAPLPPRVPADVLPLANLYVPPAGRAAGAADILPVKSLQPAPPPLEVRQLNARALAKTLGKLKTNQDVQIVFWGDSVTGGADASTPDKSFASMLVSLLRERFPQANISAENAGVGGSNTVGRLPAFQSEVLAKQPDLVVVEFINDMRLPAEIAEANYAKILAALKQAGCDVILCVPHLPVPALMGAKSWEQVAQHPYFKFLRRTARSAQTGLADVARRWTNLDREGLRPDLMLADEIIHPNDRGHAIYAEELLNCFVSAPSPPSGGSAASLRR